jgi:hypothetical protein
VPKLEEVPDAGRGREVEVVVEEYHHYYPVYVDRKVPVPVPVPVPGGKKKKKQWKKGGGLLGMIANIPKRVPKRGER